MKIQANNLIRFIEDFNLEAKDTSICFEATILYTTIKKQIQLPSEVHIIRLKATGLEVVYLLDRDVIKFGIPERIEDTNSMHYRQNEFLYVKGVSREDGHFILSIHPTGSLCDPNTLRELHQKIYN